ncbi:DUF4190 domain-containing protein [Streptomyces sp. NPDC052040]|uniref:DUF4190 domain-containing protein n=1 Tax=Streptomyces sp. NPDC052040 TaxID=3365682 RepID=UPI0037CDFB7C
MAIPPPPGPQQPGGPYPQDLARGPHGSPGSAPPYQPWGQGYSPYNRPAPVNGLAIAALVLGFLCFLPGVGLVLGLIALAQIRRRGERGEVFAVGGIVLSLIGLALFLAALSSGSAHHAWEGIKSGAHDDGAVFTVRKGECFNAPGGSLEGEAYNIDKVPCSGAHQAEVFADFTLPQGRFPGEEAVTRAAGDRCYALRATYAMDAWAVPADVDVYYFTPTRGSWRLGDRRVTCLFGNTDKKGTLTGTLRSDSTTLTGDQLAYLRGDAALYEALDAVPDDVYAQDDLPRYRAWALRVSTALDDQSRRLRGHSWPQGLRGPVAGQAEALDRARDEWNGAATAADADSFYDHCARGGALLEGRAAVTAREALGLATTPPAPEKGEGQGSADASGGGRQV